MIFSDTHIRRVLRMANITRSTEVLTRSQSSGLAFTVLAAVLTALAGIAGGASAFDQYGSNWIMLGAPLLGLIAVWLAARSTLPETISKPQGTGLILIMTCAVIIAAAGVATGAFFIHGDQELAFALSLLATTAACYFLYQTTFVTFTTK